MLKTPRGMRLHIGIFGKRNVGKSSVLNKLTKQNISIVSDTAGTTTDPVEKAMEMLPLGPILFIDTAGIDDKGSLGEKRISKTKKIFDRTDLAIIVSEPTGWGEFEHELFKEFQGRKIPVIAVINKIDEQTPDLKEFKDLNIEPVLVSALEDRGISDLKQRIIRTAPEEFLTSPTIAADLVPPGEMAILVIPIDFEAPKGRIILPQVQTIRDLLDNDSMSLVVKETELKDAIERQKVPPALVITDSQAFEQVSATVSESIPLTSFSILFARLKGELNEYVRGTLAIEGLKDGDKVLICESCTHHPIQDDIGRDKIPKWLNNYIGGTLRFDYATGHDFPEDISEYKLIIQCGACMTNRREILSRIAKANDAGVPITNYGLTIAYALKTFERVLEPFPKAKQLYEESLQCSKANL